MTKKEIARMPDNTRNALLEYEIMLRTGEPSVIPSIYFQQSVACNEKTAIAIFRYAIEEVLGWSPEEAYNQLDKETVDRMLLQGAYKYLRYPKELVKDRDQFYAAAICYPSRIHVSINDLIINRYRAVCSKRNGKFPKDYFTDAVGEKRAIVCLRYVLMHVVIFDNPESLYELFSNKSAGKEFLRKHRLDRAQELLYDSPLDYLQAAMPPHQRDNLLYAYGKFLMAYQGSKVKRLEAKAFPSSSTKGRRRRKKGDIACQQ